MLGPHQRARSFIPPLDTADDDANRSGPANVRTGATLHLPRGAVTEVPDMSVEIARRTRACWMRIRRYLRELFDQPKVALSLKIRMAKAEAIEALLLYGCSTWTLRQEHYAKLRTVHHRVLLRIIGAQPNRPDHRMTSYNRALGITGCERIETTLRTRRLRGGDAPPNEWRAAAEANHFRKP